MKISAWIIFGLLFIILISYVYAACPEPDISTYHSCTNGCPDAVKYTEKYATCINTCISSWTKIQDAYRACQKTEEEQKKLEEQKLLEEQNKTKVSNVRGNVSIVRADGTRKSASENTVLQDGDKVETGQGGSATLEIPDADHSVTLGSESAISYRKKAYIVDLLFGRLRMKVLKRMLRPGETIVGGGIHSQIVLPGKGGGAIRGTDFIAENYGNTGRFYVQEGIVDVTNIKNETFEIDAWEMIILYENGTAVKSNLSANDWYGLLNSIETGEEYIPTAQKEKIVSEEQKTKIIAYLISIAIGLLIIFGALKIKKLKKKK